MATIFNGEKKAQEIYKDLEHRIKKLKHIPSLAIIRASTKENTKVFTNMKKKRAAKLGIKCDIFDVSENFNKSKIVEAINSAAQKYTGILVQLPLPTSIDRYEILNLIPREKDVEGLGSTRFGESMQKEVEIYSPMAKGIFDTIKEAAQQLKLQLKGKYAVIVGNSYLTGKPVSQILINLGCTVTICDINTNDISKFTKNADIIISSTGQEHIIQPDMVKNNVIAIDGGYEKRKNGEPYGDIHPDVVTKAAFFTPVPGGVSALTIAYIFKNLIILYENENNRT
ncbi:bifunctional 5,10-methylenetetrahydrofolate dehydrogenase/5,10-methenyltetrahydrofolate cyclohydrolase [Candidatus Dojkabacteria bacterium]|nr:bifunctional 5,10-methylenetetrahydrofolate dehydrogenase/5,10-methenyltetrahydrofolate cyclohydrolase [Candidatus Dojkabacteria bacterium]